MSDQNSELVISLDAKRIIALSLITVFSIFTIYSYITALFAFVAPSEGLPLNINSVVTSNINGTSKSSFSRGSTVLINATVEKAVQYLYSYSYYNFSGSTDYLLMVKVQYKGVDVFFGFVADSLTPGVPLSRGLGFRIPNSASTGTYKVYVYVWSTWLPDGNVLADNSGYSTTFTVT
jgi:hypothetical protein